MRLKIETRSKPQHASRLNRIVFGVALLWLVTSVLLLVLSGTGSAQSDHKYEHKNDRTRKNAHHQLFAQVEHQAAARASFLS
jgi:preprotein translocase subunit SecG